MGRQRKNDLHLPKYVTLNHGSYYFKGPGMDKPQRVCREGDEGALYKFLGERLEPSGPIVTLGDSFDRYEREVLPGLAPRTQKDYRRHLGVLRAWCGHMRHEELTRREIGEFMNVQKGRIHRVRIVAVLSSVFSFAMGQWYVTEANPCIGLKRPKSGKRRRYVTDAEFKAFYDAAPIRIQIAMDLALLTGQRQGDLLSLRWDQVLEDGVLFTQGKTGKRLKVGMSEALKAVLDRARKVLPMIPRQYVLRTAKGKLYTSEGFRSIWQRYMRLAMKRGALTERFTFHDLRAKSVSDSKSLDEAFERAGHTSMAMTRGVYDRGIREVKPLK